MLSPTLLKSTLLFLLPLMLKAVPIFLSCHSLISFSINCPPPKITYIFIAALWIVLLDCQANTSSPKYHDENTKRLYANIGSKRVFSYASTFSALGSTKFMNHCRHHRQPEDYQTIRQEVNTN